MRNAIDVRQAPDGTWKIEYLPNGAYGWAQSWSVAMWLAHEASLRISKRHRVYWSPNGKAWMIRRAFMLGALTDREERREVARATQALQSS